MIDYFCGYPKCGKSKIAESLLSAIESPVLYVGTLPNIRPYWNTILTHRKRRPSTWDLYECSGNLIQDLSCLLRMMECYGGILLDGGAFYLNRLLYWGDRPGLTELALLKRILSKAAIDPVYFVVVDQPLAGMPPRTQELGRIFHQVVYSYCKHTYLVVDGQAMLCPLQKLRTLDCEP